jgi:DNA-binding HxlR family transcriptional regulator
MCPIARSLDVVGERWSLLIVRELLLGPKRFKDLLGELPSMGTNRLSDRLKTLEADGIVARATLPPPGEAQVYVLTDLGERLRQPVVSWPNGAPGCRSTTGSIRGPLAAYWSPWCAAPPQHRS